MNFVLAREVMMKDLQDIRRNGYVFYSMLFVPLLLVGLGVLETSTLSNLPAADGSFGVSGVSELFSSIYVIIPAIITTLIGSTSVIIEKTNHSLEPLLGTPISDSELFAGKAMAPFIPALLISWFAYGLYIGISDLITYPSLGYLLFPTTLTYVQIFFLTPVVGLLGTFSSLLVSSRMKDVRAAQQVSSLVVLPVLILVFIPIIGAGSDFLINLLLGAALLAAAIGLFFVTVKAFRRENILVSWG